MTYLNAVIKRTKPMTRCQCAVLAVLGEVFSSVDEIWRREPIYYRSRFHGTQRVAYGTIAVILRGLVQQGFVEAVGGRRKKYRVTGV
jgi:DNA-binding PadR family transcriptional regulator